MGSNSAQLAPCGGCGDLIGPIHVSPICSDHMHPLCGKPVGQEGFGQHVVCPDYDSGKPQAVSAPFILKAFALQGNKDAISSKDAANDVDSDESSKQTEVRWNLVRKT
ncbi:hypothetical protein L914_20528 [Phytophthora nicotianae]|uniref:Uncharacterized protein n=1 Tax=Phytophthora nicotianae TaxID=4792 RepID=W2M6N8_PHYNI|nr:hypothetical protein L914_20528 [Phytophthora nicotianae]